MGDRKSNPCFGMAPPPPCGGWIVPLRKADPPHTNDGTTT